MRYENLEIKVEDSQPGSSLRVYLIEPSAEFKYNERPLILLCPGGGYEFVSDREAEILALQFMAMGYHTAVLRYSVAPAVFPTALMELAKAMSLIKVNSADWHVKADQIVVLGCSAGGHLAASLGVFWNDKELDIAGRLALRPSDIQPAGLILCYPVITSGEYAHRGSFDALLKGIQTEELLDKVSLEKQVSEDVPPVFIWHTFTDGLVPVENSLRFVSALKAANVSTEFHMYSVGGHGLSIAKESARTPMWNEVQPECQNWVVMAETWLNGLVGFR